MEQHLYKYLVLYKHLSIPQLGTFLIEKVNARYDEDSQLLYAPKPMIRFTDGDVPVSEKIFYDFLANELGVDEVTAGKLFHDFSAQFQNTLGEKGTVTLKGVGTLTQKTDGKISFQPAHNITEFLPPVKPGAALPVADQSAEIENYEESDIVETKDNWWMYAIILLLLGLGALILYYT